MEPIGAFGTNLWALGGGPKIEELQVMSLQPLRRVLNFTGVSIHDVINDPFKRRLVAGYFKLSKAILRNDDVVELERQWNPLGLRT